MCVCATTRLCVCECVPLRRFSLITPQYINQTQSGLHPCTAHLPHTLSSTVAPKGHDSRHVSLPCCPLSSSLSLVSFGLASAARSGLLFGLWLFGPGEGFGLGRFAVLAVWRTVLPSGSVCDVMILFLPVSCASLLAVAADASKIFLCWGVVSLVCGLPFANPSPGLISLGFFGPLVCLFPGRPGVVPTQPLTSIRPCTSPDPGLCVVFGQVLQLTQWRRCSATKQVRPTLLCGPVLVMCVRACVRVCSVE